MSYGNLGQKRPGTLGTNSQNPKTQPGSASNQTASNAAKRGSKVATSDTYPSGPSVGPRPASRPEPDPQSRLGYKKAQNAASKGPIRKVGKTIKRERM